MPFDGTKLDDATLRLIKGREQIERGWCQGALRDETGAVCMLGAILPEGGIFFTDQVMQQAKLRLLGANGIPNIPDWNNDPQRTKAEVLAAFDHAIAAECV